MSTGPRTEEGKRRCIEATRRRWAAYHERKAKEAAEAKRQEMLATRSMLARLGIPGFHEDGQWNAAEAEALIEKHAPTLSPSLRDSAVRPEPTPVAEDTQEPAPIEGLEQDLPASLEPGQIAVIPANNAQVEYSPALARYLVRDWRGRAVGYRRTLDEAIALAEQQPAEPPHCQPIQAAPQPRAAEPMPAPPRRAPKVLLRAP